MCFENESLKKIFPINIDLLVAEHLVNIYDVIFSLSFFSG